MTQVPITPGSTEIQLTARGRANRVPPELLEVPGGLYPLMSAAFEIDEYRIMAGWPVPVPDGDIQIDCLVSAEGDVIGNRDSPLSITTNAAMRWVADDNYYDQTTLQWTPVQGHVSPWQTSPESAPTLINDYEYSIGDEVFMNMSALNFDSNTADYMWNDLTGFMGGTFGYTVLMVMSPNSMYGNDATVVENALWGPATPDGAWVMLTVADQMIWMTTEEKARQKSVAIGRGEQNMAPMYVAISVNRPQTTLYAALGPSNVDSKALAAGEAPEALSTSFWLGNAPFPSSSTMDMTLLDLSIYGDPLNRADLLAEISTLSAVYGGDS